MTRRGRRVKNRDGLKACHHASLLPQKLLHPALLTKVVAEFIRGDYDTAVFQAFKEVEVAVRDAAKLAPTDIGVPLVRKAFDKTNGPLSETTEAERDALAHLFASALGRYRNPQSHRRAYLRAG